jgi:hypothetical protein
MLRHWSTVNAARFAAKLIDAPALTAAANCWLSVPRPVASIFTTVVPAAMLAAALPLAVTLMPATTPVVVAGTCKVMSPAADGADVMAVMAAPGSMPSTCWTAASSVSNGGALPSLGSWNEEPVAVEGAAGSCR